jgi:glycosyltransferase involved in cell wall biosynthesis
LPKLVIVGRRGWLTDDIFTLMTTDPETKDDFICLQGAKDEELSWLYSNCLFTIYPSFYEGWGLPIAESIAHGTPVLASNTSSMPEIAGDLIDYFSPTSSDECLQAIIQLMDPAKRTAAKKKLKQYEPTSWDQTFKSVTMYSKEQT